jgi:hypothetical protein
VALLDLRALELAAQVHVPEVVDPDARVVRLSISGFPPIESMSKPSPSQAVCLHARPER